MEIITSIGANRIDNVEIGDLVLTHAGNYKQVIGKDVHEHRDMIISINGIKSTLDHKYYVLHKKYKNIVTNDNIHEYAVFIEAKCLTDEYFLLKID